MLSSSLVPASMTDKNGITSDNGKDNTVGFYFGGIVGASSIVTTTTHDCCVVVVRAVKCSCSGCSIAVIIIRSFHYYERTTLSSML
jgi:hypothetical protein